MVSRISVAEMSSMRSTTTCAIEGDAFTLTDSHDGAGQVPQAPVMPVGEFHISFDRECEPVTDFELEGGAAAAAVEEPQVQVLETIADTGFMLRQIPGSDGSGCDYDLEFTEVRLQDLMTLSLPCVVHKLSPKALLLLMYYYNLYGTATGIMVLDKRDFALNRIFTALTVTDGVTNDANKLLEMGKMRAEDVADRLAQITRNNCIGIAQQFLKAYHEYSTGGKMQDTTIKACKALLPRILEIGYIAFGYYVVEMIVENYQDQELARDGKKKAKDDKMENITIMKCVMEDIKNRVGRMFDQLERRGLREFTYMDSCRVTFGIFREGIQRWAASGFTSAYPTEIVLRMVDLDPQMVLFHRALFAGPQFEHLEMDMYTVADEHLATSCVYFNFCSIGGTKGINRFKSWYMAKLAVGACNPCMPFVSFTIRGMKIDAWARMTSDHLMRMCSMRGNFLTFEPTRVSDDGTLLVWHHQDSTKTDNGSMVRTLNAEYDRMRTCQLVPMPTLSKPKVQKIPAVARQQDGAMKASKDSVEKAKTVRAAKRELKK